MYIEIDERSTSLHPIEPEEDSMGNNLTIKFNKEKSKIENGMLIN